MLEARLKGRADLLSYLSFNILDGEWTQTELLNDQTLDFSHFFFMCTNFYITNLHHVQTAFMWIRMRSIYCLAALDIDSHGKCTPNQNISLTWCLISVSNWVNETYCEVIPNSSTVKEECLKCRKVGLNKSTPVMVNRALLWWSVAEFQRFPFSSLNIKKKKLNVIV